MQGEPRWMEQAIALATENVRSGRGGPFGAVVVQGQQAIATGVNLVTSSNDPTAHAEVIAIRNACAALGTFRLEGCVLYTSCEPCPMCLAASYWARVDAILFGNTHVRAAEAGFDDARLYDEMTLPLEQRSVPMAAMLSDAAKSSFDAWAESPYRIQY